MWKAARALAPRMTVESKHHPSGPLTLAMVLAASAGFIDAFIDIRVTPVFVANMSGNLVRLGIASGRHDARAGIAALVALGGFIGGAMLATASIDARVRRVQPPTPVPLLWLESFLLAVLTVIVVAGRIDYSATLTAIDVVVIVIGATAMGIQAVALRRVGQIAVSTTYGTGAVVRLAEKLALGFRRADRPGDIRRRRSILVLGGVLISYVIGAYVGTALGTSRALLVIPAIIPAIAALLFGRRQHSRPAA